MATGATPETIHAQDTSVGALLPFSDLDKLEFGQARPRDWLPLHKITRYHYGRITITNYLACHTKKSLRLRGKHVSDLKAFVDLPVELLLLVIEYLHPIDLYHFSHVSRYFRRLVLHPAALSAWKAAFRRHPDLPTPPPGTKESQWAFLIYGPAICGVCGKYGAITDFSLQKRFCGPCLHTHIIRQKDFRDESNRRISSRHVIWTLIPYTTPWSGIHYATDTTTFLKTDFSIMWKKLQLIRILCDNGLCLLSPLYADYISARKGYIQKLMNSAVKCNKWAHRIICQFANEGDKLTNRLIIKCKTRLKAVGYDTRDIYSASLSIRRLLQHKAINRLTRRAFREIRPAIDVLLRNCQIERIQVERRRLLLGIYQDYVKARPPDEWSYLPDVHTPSILDTELFKKLLGQPINESVNITPGNVVPFLPEFVEKWIKARREKFADILPKDPNEALEARVRRLELVTSVVTCRTCADRGPLVGWESISRHQLNSRETCQRLITIGRAVAAATSLVLCIGLDPLTTTVDDMNRRDDRFMCGNCTPKIYHGRLSRRVYTWLECLKHAMANDHGGISVDHAKPVWLPLTPAAARFVHGHEKPYPDPSIYVWRCNHCAHHFDTQVPQADALDHVKRVHCISIPAIGVDVIVDPRKPIHKRREVFRLSLDPAYDHICKHCSNMPIFCKLWERGILMSHLIKRHRIPEPAEHVDWEAVPIIALPAAMVPEGP